MEITRLQPYPLTFEQGGFTASTDYVVAILNSNSVDLVEIPVTSDVAGVISTPLPDYFSRYDAEYRVEVYVDDGLDLEGDHIRGDFVWTDTLTIMRPYVDVTLIAEMPSEVDELVEYEAVARALINAITGGFKYERTIVEASGTGTDYLPLSYRVNKINLVSENNEVVFDADPTDPAWSNVKEYIVTPDRSAITRSTTGGFNRMQSRPLKKRRGSSDSFTNYNSYDSPNYSEAVYDSKTFVDLSGASSMFPEGWDYTLSLDTGWPIIPEDIKRATIMLINDLKCNTLPYANAYMKEYESDQFKIKFNDLVFKGTGNGTVDLILAAYTQPMYRLGAL